MVDIEKGDFHKPWMFHDEVSSIKQRFYDNHLPPIKTSGHHQNIVRKGPTKQRLSTVLPPIQRTNSPGSILDNLHEKSTTSITSTTSAAREAAQRFILRNQLARFAQESASHQVYGPHGRRKTLYQHVQPKIDTGLARTETNLQRNGLKAHRLGGHQPLNWAALKKFMENDEEIRSQSGKLQFNSGENYAGQLTSLSDLVRMKVKRFLSSGKLNQLDQYKIVVHLTVIPRQASGLNIASRCLWNTRTDNSITYKMTGVDCDILTIVFLCRTENEII